MAAKAKVNDQYANIAYLSHTMIAATALEFSRLDIVSGALLGDQKFGLELLRAEFYLKDHDSLTDFGLEDDFILYGLCVTDSLSDTGLHHPEILSQIKEGVDLRTVAGAADANIIAFPSFQPLVQDFAAYGGILVPADRLWIYCDTTGSNAADAGLKVECRLFYKTVQLSTEQYWELIESRRIITT